ncbi:MAG TPA: biotin transporter BioY [Bryobacteraceae bacterium]|nr:biotin transporter BioY [Bryobacteraceae bacterium]
MHDRELPSFLAEGADALPLLSAMGIYGLVSYSVTQRTAEFGICVALGATSGDVVWLVLMQSLQLSMIGMLLGLAASLLLARLLSVFPTGTASFDVPTFILASFVLLAIAILAASGPAFEEPADGKAAETSFRHRTRYAGVDRLVLAQHPERSGSRHVPDIRGHRHRGLFGPRLGALTVIAWLAEALLGMPVLAQGASGILPFAGATAGYLVSFPVAAAFVGWLVTRRGNHLGPVYSLGIMLGGTAINLLMGALWLAATVGGQSAFTMGVLPFPAGALARALHGYDNNRSNSKKLFRRLRRRMGVRLRRHHLPCIVTFVGKGYSAAFVANCEEVVNKIAGGREAVEIVCGRMISADRCLVMHLPLPWNRCSVEASLQPSVMFTLWF